MKTNSGASALAGFLRPKFHELFYVADEGMDWRLALAGPFLTQGEAKTALFAMHRPSAVILSRRVHGISAALLSWTQCNAARWQIIAERGGRHD